MSYKSEIYKAAAETFEITCFLFPIEEEEVDNQSKEQLLLSNMKSMVEFSGATDGMVILTPSKSLLNAMAGNMLGIDEPNKDEKEEALCEVANIISGNIAPIFSKKGELCYISPPQLFSNGEKSTKNITNSLKETVRIFLDEGAADIEVHYQV
ncbi:chemotaxis protein CheX [Aliifodinibius salipaludis]|nr:chemotaxis protein CheX [Aliifodinibius salipaludis]